MRSERPDLGPGRSDLRSGRPDSRSGRPDLRSKRPDLGPGRPNLGPERSDLRSGRSDLRFRRPDLRSWGGGQRKRKGKQKERKNCPVWNHRSSAPPGPLPKSVKDRQMITRPDTRQDSRGRLGKGRNAKTSRNSEIFVTDGPTDRHGKL